MLEPITLPPLSKLGPNESNLPDEPSLSLLADSPEINTPSIPSPSILFPGMDPKVLAAALRSSRKRRASPFKHRQSVSHKHYHPRSSPPRHTLSAEGAEPLATAESTLIVYPPTPPSQIERRWSAEQDTLDPRSPRVNQTACSPEKRVSGKRDSWFAPVEVDVRALGGLWTCSISVDDWKDEGRWRRMEGAAVGGKPDGLCLGNTIRFGWDALVEDVV